MIQIFEKTFYYYKVTRHFSHYVRKNIVRLLLWCNWNGKLFRENCPYSPIAVKECIHISNTLVLYYSIDLYATDVSVLLKFCFVKEDKDIVKIPQ